MSEPTKAYTVERVSRCVVELRVYAHNAEDAKRRANEEGESLYVDYQPRGYGRVYRAPDEDRVAPLAPTRSQ